MRATMLVFGWMLMAQAASQFEVPPPLEPSSISIEAVEGVAPFSVDIGGPPPVPRGALPAAESAPGAQDVSNLGQSPGPSEPALADLDPPALVIEILQLPEDCPFSGNPWTLAEAFSAAQGSVARLQVARAYWRLTGAVGQYRARHDESRLLDLLDDAQADPLLLRTARASARAALERAELTVIDAQFELAAVAMLPAGAPPPLPADSPHVGPYRTHFDQWFSQRTAPPQARLADLTLPISRRVVDLRAEAFRAAAGAREAALNAYQSGQGDLAILLRYAAERGRQQRELVDAFCSYNNSIADYALAVAPQVETGQLVAMLITSGRGAAGAATAAAAAGNSGVVPAGVDQPVGTRLPSRPPGSRRPTLAPPKELAVPEEPSDAAEPRELPPPAAEDEAAPISPVPAEAVEGDPAPERTGMVPVMTDPPQPVPWIARRPLSPGQESLPGADGLYPALVDKEPAVQAKQLAGLLHWIRLLPEPLGEPTTLPDCLRGVPVAGRQAGIEKYWAAAQGAAVYQALVAQRDALEELTLFAQQQSGGVPSGLADRLQSARSAAAAELLEAHRRFLEAQLELVQAAGKPLDSPWLVPATQPHAGPYRLKLDAQPAEIAQSWPVRHAAAMIPRLAESVAQSANAVVEADSARAALAAAFQSGGCPLDDVLDAIECQTRQTLSFLEMLGTYNRAIARYALAVLPSSVDVDRLVGTLVLAQP